VLDAFSRRVIGWALDTQLRASLAVAALEMGIKVRKPAPGTLIHHSDRAVAVELSPNFGDGKDQAAAI
jgi:transposase InsO family protein